MMNMTQNTRKARMAALVLALGATVAPIFAHAEAASAPVKLSAVATDLDDGNRFFMRTGGTVRDDATYDGLVAGRDYTLAAQLYHVGEAKPVGAPAFVSFVPGEPAGKASVDLAVPANRTPYNIDYAVHLTLYRGKVDAANAADAAVVAEIRDGQSPERVIQVHAIQRVEVSAEDAADGDRKLPGEGGVIRATVKHENLVAGYHYTLWGELMKPSGQSTGIYAVIPDYVPDHMNGTTTMEFTVPAGLEGIQLVPSIGLYHKKRVELLENGMITPLKDAPVPVMIASDPALDRASKTVDIGQLFEDQPES